MRPDRWTLILALMASAALLIILLRPNTVVSPGSQTCQEDEVIGWVSNDVRGCVGYEQVGCEVLEDWLIVRHARTDTMLTVEQGQLVNEFWAGLGCPQVED